MIIKSTIPIGYTASVRAINAEELSMWILQQINLGKLKFKDLDKNFRIGFSGKVKKLIGKRKFD